MAASANGHQLGCGWGGLAAAWSRQAWQSLPCPPLARCPTSLRFLKPPEGAGRPGWASGLGRRLPSLGLFPPGTFPNARQVAERRAHRSWPPHHPHHLPLQQRLHPHHLPLQQGQPPGLCTGCAPAWCTLVQSLQPPSPQASSQRGPPLRILTCPRPLSVPLPCVVSLTPHSFSLNCQLSASASPAQGTSHPPPVHSCSRQSPMSPGEALITPQYSPCSCPLGWPWGTHCDQSLEPGSDGHGGARWTPGAAKFGSKRCPEAVTVQY